MKEAQEKKLSNKIYLSLLPNKTVYNSFYRNNCRFNLYIRIPAFFPR